MIDVYKKLPGTNCKECGDPSCMAFALKVISKKRQITDCPYVAGEGKAITTQDEIVTMDDNYKRVSDELEKIAIQTNFQEAANATGGLYDADNGTETIKIKLINKIYEMRKEGLFQDGKHCEDSWTKIIIYDYIRRKGTMPLTGEWVMLGNFPDTASHVKAFQNKAEEKLAAAFNQNINGLKERCKELEGIGEKGKMKADHTYRFNLLPQIPLYMSYWEADEEFGASCKLFVDSNAVAYIDIEYLAYLLEKFVDLFIEV